MRKLTVIAALLSLLFVFNGALVNNTYADEEENKEPETSETVPGTVLELTPVNMRLALDPGNVKEKQITVKNLSDEKIDIAVYATPFSNGDGGETQDFETQTTYTQISRWISILEGGEYKERGNYSIDPKQSKEITFKMVIPEDVAGGGQYASIIVELVPKGDVPEGSIQTISRAGMVLYADISGDTKRSAHIGDISARTFVFNGNIGITSTVVNEGNIDFQASTEVIVSSIFGKELYRNTTLSVVFPENSKTILAEWGETPGFGIYRLQYNLNALDISASGSQLVVVMAPFIFGLFIVLIIASIIAIVFLIKKHTVDKDADIIIG